MQANQIPAKFSATWGNAAGNGYIRSIPAASQIGINNGAASLADGFPPLCFTPVGSGGIPPSGQDFNGILAQITAWSRWQAAGALPQYDQTFSAAIGGYPMGAVLASTTAGKIWLCIADNNTTNPDGSSPSGWVAIATAGAGSIAVAQAAGSPFNFKTLTSPTRTNASAASAGLQIAVLSGLTYVKKSATSNVAVTLGFFSYSPVTAGQGNGAATARLVTSTSVFTDFALNNSLLVNGAPVGAGYNTPTIVLPGLPVGSIGLGLTYRRDDSAAWNTIFNPNNSDFGGISNSPVSTFFIWEYEPTA